jgi:hypothetical protein
MFRTPWLRTSEGGIWSRDIEIGRCLGLRGEPWAAVTTPALADLVVIQEAGGYVARPGLGRTATVNGYPLTQQKLEDGDELRFGSNVAVFCLPVDFFAGLHGLERPR